MSQDHKRVIYTIGHSTYTLEDFMNILQKHGIKVVVDVRRFPGSKRYLWFNKENLEKELGNHGIDYTHFEALGGRRKVLLNSPNNRWRNDAFRGYADYMETADFEKAIKRLEDIALERLVVYMCSEAVWWSCHRSMISDFLKAQGWTILHVMNNPQTVEHPYTAAARIANGRVYYSDENLFS